MGTLTAKSIIDKAALLLNDTANTRWTRAELLLWLGQAQRATIMRSPSTANVITTMQLQPGTRQRIPSTSWLLLDITRNMGTDGLTPGKTIRIITQELLDAFAPNWHMATPSTEIENFIYSPKDNKGFFVYPPSDGTGFIEVNCSLNITDITAETEVIKVPDIFESALVDYICFRAHSKDAEYAAGLQLATMYRASFVDAIQSKDQAELQSSPNMDLAPFDPTVSGTAA